MCRNHLAKWSSFLFASRRPSELATPRPYLPATTAVTATTMRKKFGVMCYNCDYRKEFQNESS
ncbi:hypothetical protein IJH06_00685 [Candidatus Saccharibacteria bacterium]|nr:hypothetical protein [Candidatus Saccharibacteria bacterium]